jgi:surface protein
MKNFTILFITLIIVSCSKEEELPFYVAKNGVTIKAREWVTVGTTADLNGVTYTAVDLASLKEWIKDGNDLSKVVTTFVSDTTHSQFAVLFHREVVGFFPIKGIESWDVSNFKDIQGIFYSSQPVESDLSGWDVSKVTNMGLIMQLGDVNPNINNWDVSSATNMTSLILGNKDYIEGMDLSGWDVSKVTKCDGLTESFSDGNWPESKRPNFTNCNPD